MRQSSAMFGWDELRVEALRQLDEQSFEDLVWELVCVERSDRHAADADAWGPPKKFGTGADSSLTILSPPRIDRAAYKLRYGVSLTPDFGKAVYSVKTGANLQKTLLDEAKPRKARAPKSPASKAAQPKADWRFDTLRDGGRLIVVLSEPAGDGGAGCRSKLVAAYAKRLRDADRSTDGLEDRIEIMDANHVHQFLIRRRPVEISTTVKSKLGVVSPTGVLSLAGWKDTQRGDRAFPAFHWDTPRNQFRTQLLGLLGSPSDVRVAWVLGPPGIGKTRLVSECLAGDPDIARRALVAPSFEDARAALRDHEILRRFPTAVLVVDECPPASIIDLPPWIPAGRLVVVLSPADPEHVARSESPAVVRLAVGALENAAIEGLIREESGPGDVQELARLVEGYPWFAVLAARGMRDGAKPHTVREVAEIALCERRDAHRAEVIQRRARALLLAMLTENVNWDELAESDKLDLCNAVELTDWAEVRRLAEECRLRGLLRFRLGRTYKYVTPAILAREVVLMLLSPGDGPVSPLGPKLRRNAAKYLPAFYERLEKIGINASILAALAQPIVERISSADTLRALSAPDCGVAGAEILFAARHRPIPLGSALRCLIETTSLEELRALAQPRRALVWALDEISTRRDGFDDAEAALFRLACAENESFANNATGTWSALFHVELPTSYATLEDRIERLRDRWRTPDAASRRVVLRGLEAVVALRQHGRVNRERDGSPPELTRAEARRARTAAWKLLIDAMMDDDVVGVAAAAAAVVSGRLREAVRSGLAMDVALLLVSSVDRFAARVPGELRAAFEVADTYDGAIIDRTNAREAWERLRAALEPRTFEERLRHRALTWPPTRSLVQQAADDEALAREGLSPPDRPLLGQLEWLCSTEAARRMPLLIALGKVDVAGAVVDFMIQRAAAGDPEPLSAYVVGWQQAGRENEADALLRQRAVDPALAGALVLSAWRLGLSDTRASWVAELIERHDIPPFVIGMLAYGGWPAEVTDAAMQRFVSALLLRDDDVSRLVVLSVLVDRAVAQAGSAARWLEPLRKAFVAISPQRVSGYAAHEWARAAGVLQTLGATSDVVQTAAQWAAADDHVSAEVWSVLRECASAHPAETWAALRVLLGNRGDVGWRLAMGTRRYGIFAVFDATEVVDWVGGNADRALLIARGLDMHAGDDLPEIARRLIVQFGAESTVAREIETNLGSTPGSVSSIAEFEHDQTERAARWTKDEHAEVRRWAKRVTEDFRRASEAAHAHEEYEQRRWGT